MLIEIVIFISLLFFWWYKNDQKKYSKYPPGPFRFPFVGNVFHLMSQDSFPAKALKKLADKYGDPMFLKLGAVESVVFTSKTAIHEMLNHESTAGRTQYEFIKDRTQNKNLGLIWGYGRPWHEIRRFTVRNLREFGFGKSAAMDSVVAEEVEKFVSHLAEEVRTAPGNVIHVEDMFGLFLINVLWRFVSGKTYDYRDKKMLRLLQLNNEFYRTTNVGMDITDPFPFLRDWFPNWTGRNAQIKATRELYQYGKEILEEQKRILEESGGEVQSFIDIFTKKVEESKNDPDTSFTEEQFILTILDLFIAGSETSSNSLTFGILYILLHPEVQAKVHEEIDRVIPGDTPFDSSIKPSMPYTTATVLEILRLSTVIPLPAAREATEDFYFRDYLIRKGTSLVFNTHAVNYSPETWQDPNNFRPDRFLNAAGTEVDKKMVDSLEVFGAGMRYCLGQSLANVSLFVSFTSVMRRFRFEKVPGTNPTMEPILAVTLSPHPFSVRVVERK